MNPIKSLLFFAVLFTPFASFAQNVETRNVASFNSIEAIGSSNVIIEKGAENSVTIEYEGIDADKIITEVKDGTLKVRLADGSYQNVSVSFYITYKKLVGISNSGSGKFWCKSPLSAPKFKLINSGSGSLKCEEAIKAGQLSGDLTGSGNLLLANIETEVFDLSMAGSGRVEVNSGHASRLVLHKSGSGDYEAYGVKSDSCKINMSGSGDVEITASESIEANMSGSGNIHYKGDAVVQKVRASGSGEIAKR